MVCKTEERSILEGASVYKYGQTATVSVSGGALIDGNFNTEQESQKGSYSAPLTGNYLAIVLDKQRGVRTVLIANKERNPY